MATCLVVFFAIYIFVFIFPSNLYKYEGYRFHLKIEHFLTIPPAQTNKIIKFIGCAKEFDWCWRWVVWIQFYGWTVEHKIFLDCFRCAYMKVTMNLIESSRSEDSIGQKLFKFLFIKLKEWVIVFVYHEPNTQTRYFVPKEYRKTP